MSPGQGVAGEVGWIDNTHLAAVSTQGASKLWDYQWAQVGGWSLTDISDQPGVQPYTHPVFTTPAGHELIQSGSPVLDVYVGDLNQYGIMEFWCQNGAWHASERPSSGTNTWILVSTSPTSYNYTLSGSAGLRHSCFSVGLDGELWEWYFDLSVGTGWHLVGHGTPSGTQLGNSPSGYFE